MDVGEDLKHETEKWLKKAKEKRKDFPDGKHTKNIDAYISDSQHFMKKGDLVRAFEAVIWAWAWMEILEELEK